MEFRDPVQTHVTVLAYKRLRGGGREQGEKESETERDMKGSMERVSEHR